MTTLVHPVILCGGAGTRLWPLSTPEHPKQFLPLTTSNSMLQETAQRFRSSRHPDLSFSELLVIGSHKHAHLLDRQLPDARKVLEPFGRNSAPAIAAACLTHGTEDLILILPADHSIQDVEAFHQALAIAAKPALDGAIVTLGITPTHPATGYGYIKVADPDSKDRVVPVEAFVEKPDLPTAQNYLTNGSYYWNAGIFLFTAGTMRKELAEYAPDVLAGVERAIHNLDGRRIELKKEAFERTPSISIDYAIMEKSKIVKTIPVTMGWSDVGGYRALQHMLTSSEMENVAYGPVHIENSSGLYVRSEGPAVSISGASNLAVVATSSEVMITAIDNDSAVKSLGRAVQNKRHTLGLSEATLVQAQSWLSETFNIWSERAWDQTRGGFVEQLQMDGAPDELANRRVRVQGRQVYSFAKSIEMGWLDKDAAYRLVRDGIDYLNTHARHPDGGWAHALAPNGDVINDTRDLYDHAFIILAGVSAYQATGSELGLRLSEEAFDFINAHLRQDDRFGWCEGIPATLPRRSNPHMHLLEALLALHEATERDDVFNSAGEIVTLFETRLFQPRDNILGEFFTKDWSIITPQAGAHFEPGHHYEWAYLLHAYQDKSGHDTTSWRRRLMRKADENGRNQATNFLFNSVTTNGCISNSNSRLWPQLEEFRASLFHPDIVSRNAVENHLRRILENYLNRGPEGGWVDELDAKGESVSRAVPASMLYHLVTAFQPIT